MKLGWSIFSKQ